MEAAFQISHERAIRRKQDIRMRARELYGVWQSHQSESLPFEHLHDREMEGWLAVAEDALSGTERLNELVDATDNAILAVTDIRSQISGAINWANLECAGAELCIDQDGDKHYEVFIEEADAVNPAFHQAISKGLKERGFPDIVVVTEW